MKRAVLALAFVVFALVLVACGSVGNAEASVLETPSYYVFDSTTIDGTTITDPNDLVLDGGGVDIENWYHLSISLIDDKSGKLCTDGRIVNFTYNPKGKTIRLHASTNQGIDFGFDGQTLEVGDGTLTLRDAAGTTVLKRSEEQAPAILGKVSKKQIQKTANIGA